MERFCIHVFANSGPHQICRKEAMSPAPTCRNGLFAIVVRILGAKLVSLSAARKIDPRFFDNVVVNREYWWRSWLGRVWSSKDVGGLWEAFSLREERIFCECNTCLGRHIGRTLFENVAGLWGLVKMIVFSIKCYPCLQNVHCKVMIFIELSLEADSSIGRNFNS